MKNEMNLMRAGDTQGSIVDSRCASCIFYRDTNQCPMSGKGSQFVDLCSSIASMFPITCKDAALMLQMVDDGLGLAMIVGGLKALEGKDMVEGELEFEGLE